MSSSTSSSSSSSLDLVSGMKAIAAHYGIPERKAYGLARQNLLPGVFALGRSYFLDPEVARDSVRARAKAGIRNEGSAE